MSAKLACTSTGNEFTIAVNFSTGFVIFLMVSWNSMRANQSRGRSLMSMGNGGWWVVMAAISPLTWSMVRDRWKDNDWKQKKKGKKKEKQKMKKY